MTLSPFISGKDQEREFCKLLREVIEGSKLVSALFEHRVFKYRGLKICCGLTRNREDADDLFQEVCLKVLRGILGFVPDYTKDYGNFFAWYRRIAVHTFYDKLPTHTMQFHDERVEDLHDLEDHGADIEFQILRDELERHINNLPAEQRLVTMRFLEGYSLREIQEELNNWGIKRSHVTVGKWVRDGLKPFFPDENVLSFKMSGGKRKARARTRTCADDEASSIGKVSGI